MVIVLHVYNSFYIYLKIVLFNKNNLKLMKYFIEVNNFIIFNKQSYLFNQYSSMDIITLLFSIWCSRWCISLYLSITTFITGYDNDYLTEFIQSYNYFYKYIIFFCETRTKRCAEIYRGKNLHPRPWPTP